MFGWFTGRVNGWVVLVSILVAVGLMIMTVLALLISPVPAANTPDPSQAITIIPAPTFTLIPTREIVTPTATQPPSLGGIAIGDYVQITGTDGQGLRLRSGPGTDYPPRFLGMDAEVFMVVDGPRQSDDFIWWFLEAPYDPERSGWAAASYLAVVSPTTIP